MVGPARKREAVGHLQSDLEMSQRRACKVVGQPRAPQRHVPQPDAEETRLRERLNEFSRQRPRAGYRTACGQLRQEGLRVNPKRVQRLWLEEGLKVPRKQCQKRRLGTSENGSRRRVATRPNEVWSYDFVSDQTSEGRRLQFLCVVAEFTRECLALAVRRRFRAKDVMAVLVGLIAQRGVPAHLRSDNGPEFVAQAVAGVAEGQCHWGVVYRAGQSVGERVCGIVQPPAAGRTFEPRRICLPVGGGSPGCRMAAGLQRGETAFVAGVSGAGGVRRALARSGRGYAPPCARQRGTTKTMNQNSHSKWINKRGLAKPKTALRQKLAFLIRV